MIDKDRLAEIQASIGKPAKNTKAVGWVIARVSSERFPGKVYLDLCGKPMWWHILQRVEAGARLAGVQLYNNFILTTADASNDILERQARQYGYSAFRYDGPEWNVCGRQQAAVEKYGAGITFEASGDCPLGWYYNSTYFYECVRKFNCQLEPTWVHGDPQFQAGEVVGALSIRPGWFHEIELMLACTQEEHEHTGLIWTRDWDRRYGRIVRAPRDAFYDLPEEYFRYHRWYRLDVDTYQDGVQMQELYGRFWNGKTPVDTRECIKWIDEHKEYHRNADKQESAVNQEVKGTGHSRADWRFLDYAEDYLCPDGVPKLYCHECGAYMGYVTESHGQQHFHRPDGTVITGDATITCPNKHFRAWHHTMQRTITSGSMVAVPEAALHWESTYRE